LFYEFFNAGSAGTGESVEGLPGQRERLAGLGEFAIGDEDGGFRESHRVFREKAWFCGLEMIAGAWQVWLEMGVEQCGAAVKNGTCGCGQLFGVSEREV